MMLSLMNNILHISESQTELTTLADFEFDIKDKYRGSVMSTIELCKSISAFKVQCEDADQLSLFFSSMEKWVGNDLSQSNKKAAIGHYFNVLESSDMHGLDLSKLPSSFRSLGEIANIDLDKIEGAVDAGLIHRKMTSDDAKYIKNSVNKFGIRGMDEYPKLYADKLDENRKSAENIINKASTDYKLPEGADPKQAEEYESASNKIIDKGMSIDEAIEIFQAEPKTDEMRTVIYKWHASRIAPRKIGDSEEGFKRLQTANNLMKEMFNKISNKRKAVAS